MQFTIAANHINVAEWEQLFNAVPANAPPSKTKAHAIEVTNQNNTLSRTTGNGALTVDIFVYDDLKLTQVQSNVSLDDGLITLNPLTANLYNGQESGTVVINTQATPVTYNVNSHLQGVDANQLLSSISPVRTLYGLLSANADAHFTTAAGAHSILPTLNGRVSLNLKDGKVANVDLLHHLSTIGQFQQTARAIEPFTQLNQLSGNFDIRNGVAQTNDLTAAMDAGSMAASGVVDLAREQLNLHLTAMLSSSYSESVGGTWIGGFLNTALANTHGELVIPVLVTGTFQNPQFAPDLQKVGEMKLKNVLPGLDNPTSFTKGIFGQVLRGKPGQPGQSGPPVPEPVPNSLKNLFDTFGKKEVRETGSRPSNFCWGVKMSSSILYEITKLTGAANRRIVCDKDTEDELITVVGYGHLAELYPEKREYFESLCFHLKRLANLAHERQERNTSRRIRTTLQKVCKIESSRLPDAA